MTANNTIWFGLA